MLLVELDTEKAPPELERGDAGADATRERVEDELVGHRKHADELARSTGFSVGCRLATRGRRARSTGRRAARAEAELPLHREPRDVVLRSELLARSPIPRSSLFQTICDFTTNPAHQMPKRNASWTSTYGNRSACRRLRIAAAEGAAGTQDAPRIAQPPDVGVSSVRNRAAASALAGDAEGRVGDDGVDDSVRDPAEDVEAVAVLEVEAGSAHADIGERHAAHDA